MTDLTNRGNAVIPIALGAIAFFLVAGSRILDPTNIAWLGEGDPSTHYLGWLFFRHSNWSFPFGLNPNYGLELGSSILFSDSNPLLAFLFKPFSPWLPATFQYFGIWLLACFILQAWFAWKLVSFLSDNVAVRAMGAGLFVFAPPMIWRLHGHLNLAGHFLIIASLYLSFNEGLKRRKLAWSILLAISALVHPYLLIMTGLVWLANITDKAIKHNVFRQRVVLEFAIIVTVVSTACWQAGYFSVGDGVNSDGYGFYRMNLLSIFDPSGWSYILNDIPESAGDYEGFNFLGLGIIFLITCALPAIFEDRGRIGTSRAIGKYPMLSLLLVVLTAYAASNKIGIGLLGFEYPLPDLALKIANTFRASGRIFWPVFYTILFVTTLIIIRGYKKHTAVFLLGLALFIQVIDTHSGWKGVHMRLTIEPQSEWSIPLSDPFWGKAASRYTKVRWIPPSNHSPKWLTLAAFAGTHGLATDAMNLARIGTLAMENARSKALEALQTGRYEDDSLYFMDDSVIRQAAFTINVDTDVLTRVDGFTILAPGWKKCTECPSFKKEVKLIDLLPTLQTGQRMLLNQSGSGLAYLAGGWSHPEHWGIWSDGPKATIVLPFSEKHATSILIEANPLLSPSHPQQHIEVFINGVPVREITLDTSYKGMFEVKIPESILEADWKNNTLELEFHFPDAARPKDIGINDDVRELALGFIAITTQ